MAGSIMRDERRAYGNIGGNGRSNRVPLFRRLGHEHRYMPPFQAVTAGMTAFLELPLGFTYHCIDIVYGGTTFTPAKMNAIRVIVNGQVIHNLTGTLRDTLNQFDRFPAAATYKVVTIPFFRDNLRDGADLHTGLATAFRCEQAEEGIRDLRIEIDIDATAVAPTLLCFASVRANDHRLARALLRTETFVEIVPALTSADYLWLHRYNGDPLRPMLHRLTAVAADTEILNIKMQVDTKEIFNRTSKLNEHAQSRLGFRTPQVGYVVLDSGEDVYSHPWRIGDVADHRIITNHAAGNFNMTCVAETLGTLGG